MTEQTLFPDLDPSECVPIRTRHAAHRRAVLPACTLFWCSVCHVHVGRHRYRLCDDCNTPENRKALSALEPNLEFEGDVPLPTPTREASGLRTLVYSERIAAQVEVHHPADVPPRLKPERKPEPKVTGCWWLEVIERVTGRKIGSAARRLVLVRADGRDED